MSGRYVNKGFDAYNTQAKQISQSDVKFEKEKKPFNRTVCIEIIFIRILSCPRICIYFQHLIVFNISNKNDNTMSNSIRTRITMWIYFKSYGNGHTYKYRLLSVYGSKCRLYRIVFRLMGKERKPRLTFRRYRKSYIGSCTVASTLFDNSKFLN